MVIYDLLNRGENLVMRHMKSLGLATSAMILKEWLQSQYYSCTDCFHDVEVETTSICNRRCVYCPNYAVERPREYMERQLFEKIVRDLSSLRFAGNLNLHHFGEPLLDKRLPELVSFARTQLPRAGIQVFTNGDLLTIGLFRTLIQNGVNRFFITSHCVEHEGRYVAPVSTALRDFFGSLSSTEKRWVQYSVIEPGALLANRPVMQNGECRTLALRRVALIRRCSYATRLLEIDYQGKVLLCCQQQGAETGPVLGDVAKNNIRTIWEAPAYKKIRRDLRKGIFTQELCRHCGWGFWEPEGTES